MNEDRLNTLLTVYGRLMDAARLPESCRPHANRERLDKIETMIMKELETESAKPKSNDDKLPF